MNKNFWRGKKVLVTGISGFVGAHLAKELIVRGADVVGLLRDDDPRSNLYLQGTDRKATIVRGSIIDYFLVERIISEYEVDTVFHLAAQTIVGVASRSPRSTFESNIMGTWNILEACRLSRIIQRVIVASSDKAYGEHKELPYRETHPLNGLHPYDTSKVCADVLTRCYYQTYGLSAAVTRFANIYGEGDLNFSRIIPDTMRSIIFNLNPIIRSDGTPLRDYIYIKDVIRGYLMLGEKLNQRGTIGEAFNFGTNRPIDVLTLVNMIIDISGKKHLKPKILSKGKLKGEIDRQYLDFQKAKKNFGWQSEYSLSESLKRTYQWYKHYLNNK